MSANETNQTQNRRKPMRAQTAAAKKLADQMPAAEEPAAPAAAASANDFYKLPDGRERVPFGSQRMKLQFPQRPGFVRHLFNDEPGRIQDALNAGYVHVKDETTGKPTTRIVGVAREGGGLFGYLMEIPEEFYNADQALKMEPLDAFDAAIRSGKVDGKVPGHDGRYVPRDATGRPVISVGQKDNGRNRPAIHARP